MTRHTMSIHPKTWKVRLLVDLWENENNISHQLRSMICLSNTSLATMSGRADFVCHTDTDLSSAPNATTEQMFEVEMGDARLRRKMWGL